MKHKDFGIFTSLDGRNWNSSTVWFKTAKEAYEPAVALWKANPEIRPFVKIARFADSRAVHLFQGGRYTKHVWANVTEWRRASR